MQYVIEQMIAEHRHRELVEQAAEARRVARLVQRPRSDRWTTRIAARLRTRPTAPSVGVHPCQDTL